MGLTEFPKTIQQVQNLNFSGIRDSLQESVFEQGFCWKRHFKTSKYAKKGDVTFIYGIGADKNYRWEYFDSCRWNEDRWIALNAKHWFRAKDVAKFAGIEYDEKEFLDSFPENVAHAFAYYGYQCIFGCSLSARKIVDTEV